MHFANFKLHGNDSRALVYLLDFLHVLVNRRAFMELTHLFLFIATCHALSMSSNYPSLNLSHHDEMKIPFEGLHTHSTVAVLVTSPLCQKHTEFKVLSETDLTFHITCRYYTKARDVLHHYSHMPSFHGIHQDCDEIVKQLIVQLREQLRNPKVLPSFAWACFQFMSLT